MSEVASAEVPIFPTFSGFRTQVVAEGDAAGSAAGGRFSSAFKTTLKSAAAGAAALVAGGIAVAAASVTGIVKSGLDRALNIQDATAKLQGLGHSAKSVTKIMDSALSSVRGTAFGLDTAATIAASAVAAGIKPGKELTRYLKVTADTATIAGTSLDDMGSILNKASASGTVYTDTLNQLSDRGVPVFTYLQKEYGVTADELSSMVKKGQVDAATLTSVLEKNLGGAALKSGATARGAFANIGAAFSRLGAMFTTSAVSGAPQLFTSIAGAVDRAGVALAPYAEQLNGLVGPALQRISVYIDNIDFGQIVSGVAAFIGQISSGDLSGFGSTLGNIGTVLKPLFPILISVGAAVGSFSTALGGALGKTITAAMPVAIQLLNVFNGALGFLADNSSLVAPLLFTLVAAFVAYRASQALANVATAASIPVEVARIGVSIASASANFALASAIRGSTGATLLNEAALKRQSPALLAAGLQGLKNIAIWVGQTAAMVAHAVATTAVTIATKAAAAGQWLFNAALSANPIGIIIVAIAAVVAALIFFFTQTKLGQQIWTEFVRFLSEAWANIVTVAQTVFAAVVGFVQKYGLMILAAVAPVIGIPILIATHWSEIVTTVQRVFAGVVGYVTSGVSRIIAAISTVNARIAAVFTTVGKTLFNAGKAVIQHFIDGIKAMIGAVGDAVGGVMDFVGSFFPHSPAKRGPFSGRGWTSVKKSGGAIVDQLQSGIDDSSVRNAITVPLLSTAAVAANGAGAANGTGGDRPIYMDGNLFGILRQLANGEATIVLNTQNAALNTGSRLGTQGLTFG